MVIEVIVSENCYLCNAPISQPGLCDPCQVEADEDYRQIVKLERNGHNYHCASRMVCGDGCCECGNVFWHTTTGEELPIYW